MCRKIISVNILSQPVALGARSTSTRPERRVVRRRSVRAGGPGVPTREASVERSFKSASLCRVENLYYHSLITILTDTATGRRPLSHGNCQWRSPSYCRAARTTRSQGAGDLGGALEELGAKARDDPSRACAFGRAHRRLARRPAPIIEYDLPLPVCPYRRGLCS